MTERQEEQAALHALHLLDAHETRILQTEMRTDPRLREIVPEFEDAAAQIALLVPEEAPPEDCRRRVLGEIRRRRRANVKVITTPLRIIFGPWVAWATAACIALVALRYREAKHQLADQVKTLAASEAAAKSAEAQEKSRVAGLEKQITDSQTKITSLTGEVARRYSTPSRRKTRRAFSPALPPDLRQSSRSAGGFWALPRRHRTSPSNGATN